MALEKTAPISQELIDSHGFTTEEYQSLLAILRREPNMVELGIFSVMWSEHCSYKSTRKHLATLPTEAPWVICGPGENAGIIDVGEGLAAIFKMESHNHPSFIEPYQGAATGVGGILRDVFTMGARPLANLDALRFGELSHPKTRHLLQGVVAGIGGYGNCVGVPTVAGECNFDKAYNGNILVNAMNVGIAAKDKIFYSAASTPGSPIIYVGSKTGRDGIHGATMASTEFDDASEAKRPTVQVGDPFTEKRLIEACLELMATDVITAIQDMGAAGLTCSSLEMASKGGTGLHLNLDQVPQREADMTPYEIMLSESQERMLMVIDPAKTDIAEAIFNKWELDFAIIGKVTDTGQFVIEHQGKIVADVPVAPLSDSAPSYDRPYQATPKQVAIDPSQYDLSTDPLTVLQRLLGHPDLASKAWIYEQYDQQVGNNTITKPQLGAAMMRIPGTNRGLALTSDVTPRYVKADPIEGGKQAVVESYRNIIATGAMPKAITNCLNFGNPEKAEIMGQLVGAIEGMKQACLALDYPVVSGNVSLYNETNNEAILPTPTIGGVGVIEDIHAHITAAFSKEGQVILLIGKTLGHLGQSILLRDWFHEEKGPAPEVELDCEKRYGIMLHGLIKDKMITSCNDVSDGGLLVAIAKMCLAGNMGAKIAAPDGQVGDLAYWFGEDQARYVIAVDAEKLDQIKAVLEEADIPYSQLGITGGSNMVVGERKVELTELQQQYQGVLNEYVKI